MHFVIFLVLLAIILVYADKDKAKKQNRVSSYYKYHNDRTAPSDAFAEADKIYYMTLDKFMYKFVEELENVASSDHRDDCVFPDDKLDTINKAAAVRILYEFDGWWAKKHNVNIDVFSFTCGEQLYAMDLADKWFTESMGRQYEIAVHYDGKESIDELKKTAFYRYDVSVLRPNVRYWKKLQTNGPKATWPNYYIDESRPSKYSYTDPASNDRPFEDLYFCYPFRAIDYVVENEIDMNSIEEFGRDYWNLSDSWYGFRGLHDIYEHAVHETELTFKMRGVCEPFGFWKEENGKIHSVLYRGPTDHMQDLVKYGAPKWYADWLCESREHDLKLAEEYRESQQKK